MSLGLILGITIPVSIIVSLILLIFLFQNRFIYLANTPNREISKNDFGSRSPTERNMTYDNVTITTPDNVKLHGWFMKQSDSTTCPTFIFFHGIDGNMGLRLEFVSFLYEKLKVNILMVSYRGYSSSEGRPSEKGIKIDALAILDYAFNNENIHKEKIFVMGTSFGGAVAAYACSQTKYPVAGLILENTFLNLESIIAKKLKVKCLTKLLLRNHWRTVDIISSITCPIQFLTGLQDQLIPTGHTQVLYDKAEKAKFKIKTEFKLGKHKGLHTVNSYLYQTTLKNFIAKCTATP